MRTLKELYVVIQKGEALTLEEVVKVTDTLINAIYTGAQAEIDTIYNCLAIDENFIVVPAIFSVMLKEQKLTQPYYVFSKNIETALMKAQKLAFQTTMLADGSCLKQPTGKEVFIATTNLQPSSFPAVDLSALARKILLYNIDYKRSELTDIINSGYCLANIQENEIVFLSPIF